MVSLSPALVQWEGKRKLPNPRGVNSFSFTHFRPEALRAEVGEGVRPFPVTCGLLEKLGLASSGEGCHGVATAVAQTGRCPVASGCPGEASWVLFISGAWVESGLSLRAARHSGAGLMGTHNSL